MSNQTIIEGIINSLLIIVDEWNKTRDYKQTINQANVLLKDYFAHQDIKIELLNQIAVLHKIGRISTQNYNKIIDVIDDCYKSNLQMIDSILNYTLKKV